MAEFYVTEERAMAPGIAGEWPKTILKPDNQNGRLVKIEGVQEMIDGIRLMEQNDAHDSQWQRGYELAINGMKLANG